MACPTSAQKIDSNFTGLRYAFEVCIGILPGEESEEFATDAVGIPEEELGNTSPVWHALEPNSYADFGAQISKTERTPINAARQREKGVTTDLDASAGFQIDFTLDNFERLSPSFFFAAWRRSAQFGRSSQEDITDISSDVVSGTDIDSTFAAGDLVLLVGFENEADNGLNTVDSTGTDEITLGTSVADDSTPDGYIKRVGFETAADDLAVDVTGDRPALTSTTLDFADLGLIPGQWIFIGGDTTSTQFTEAGNNGFARVYSVATNRLELDKTQNTMANETLSGGETVRLFFGDLIKNENDPDDIITVPVQFERSLSTAGYEYAKGAVANQFTLNVSSADKITADLTFTAIDSTATESQKSGSFPVIDTSNVAFNTTSDFSRIRLANQSSLATPLFAFITELTLTINNNVEPAKAVGTLGAFDVTIGDFQIEGNITAYFSDVAAVNAVRNNTDVTLDFALVNSNRGWIFDVPLIALGEGRLNVEKDAPITLPLSLNGARDTRLNTTLIACYFPYLPDAADT